jgi:glycosyltransferase involved in cell wall biosynthesis
VAIPLKVLVVSHAHPGLSLGGAEVASHNLHRGLNTLPGVSSHFIARAGAPLPRHEASALMSHAAGEGEILYHAESYDHFMLSNSETDEIRRDFLRYVRVVEPDVVHFHHVIGLGLETIYAVREALPQARIVMTFHEFLSLCHHHGQMVKRSGGALCSRSTPVDCHGCFPEISPARFLRRERFIRAMLELCDHYVSPSRFLAERYIEWGLPRARVSVVENGLAIDTAAPPRALPPGGRRGRFAFFGQMIEFKGVDVLLEAAARVPEAVWGEDAAVMIFGGHLERTTPEYRARLEKLLEVAGRRARLYGPYRNADMPRLMQSVDWVVVPSTWWENSPVVIQEAFFHRRPVITANIGGMAEKVTDGVDGMHFRARSAEDLADRMIEALADPSRFDRLSAGIRAPQTHHAAAAEHLALYRRLMEASPAAGPATKPSIQEDRRVPWPASS